jgi:two-component system, chemotaxis family, chemotaxis protein CheV
MDEHRQSKLLNELESMTQAHKQNIMQIAAFEILGDTVYGINIAKIKEFAMIKDAQITQGLSSNPYQTGIAVLRGESFPIISLTKWLEENKSAEHDALQAYDIFIVCEFNQSLVAFPVKKILTIASKHSSELERPSTTESKVTYITKIELNKDRRRSKRRRRKFKHHVKTLSEAQEKQDTQVEKICFVLDVEQMLEDIFPDITRYKMHELEAFEGIGPIDTDKILVICEDSRVASSILHKTFDTTGVETFYFANGMEFQKWALKQKDLAKRLGCVITDIEMPLMDGFQVVEYVKNEVDSSIPIIVNTSMSNIGVVKKLEDMHVDSFIPKTEPLKIYQAVKKFLEGKYV